MLLNFYRASGRDYTRAVSGLTLAGLSLLVASATHAQVTFYSDRATFTSAAPNTTTITFEGEVAPNEPLFIPNGSVRSGVTFNSTGNLFIIGPQYDPSYNYGTGAVLVSDVALGNDPVTLTALLPTGTTSVGADLGNFFGSVFTINLASGETFSVTGGQPPIQGGNGFNFAGFTSATAINSISFTGPANSGLAYDNFTFGTVVPEPSEWAAMGITTLTLAGLMLRARRRKLGAAGIA